jgi:hypothetical protein
MVVLLCARLGHRSGASEERQDDIYSAGNFSETVMRHFLAIGPLAVGVAGGAFTAALVALARGPQRGTPRRTAAVLVAVAVAAVAGPAQEEHLSTGRPGADDEAKGVQVPGAGAAKNWTPRRIRATTSASKPRPRGSA